MLVHNVYMRLCLQFGANAQIINYDYALSTQFVSNQRGLKCMDEPYCNFGCHYLHYLGVHLLV